MTIPALSVLHCRLFLERSVGPIQNVVESLAGDDKGLAAIRAELEALIQPYYRENQVHQDFLMTLAKAL
jgi:hypothetical protein